MIKTDKKRFTAYHKVSKETIRCYAWYGVRRMLIEQLTDKMMDYLTIETEDCGDCLEYKISIECRDFIGE